MEKISRDNGEDFDAQSGTNRTILQSAVFQDFDIKD